MDECKECESRHETCAVIKLSAFNKLVGKHTESHKEFIKQMYQVEKKCLESSASKRNKKINKFVLGSLEKGYLDQIAQIYKGNRDIELRGR